MHRLRGRYVDRRKSGVPRTQREIRLLGVQEVRLVPRTHGVAAFGTDQQRRPFRPIGHTRPDVQLAIRHDLAERRMAPRPSRAEHRIGQRSHNRGFATLRLDELPTGVDQPRNDDARARAMHVLEQFRHAATTEAYIRIEDEYRGAFGRGRHSGVDTGRVSPIAAGCDHRCVRREGSGRFHRSVGGIVVDER